MRVLNFLFFNPYNKIAGEIKDAKVYRLYPENRIGWRRFVILSNWKIIQGKHTTSSIKCVRGFRDSRWEVNGLLHNRLERLRLKTVCTSCEKSGNLQDPWKHSPSSLIIVLHNERQLITALRDLDIENLKYLSIIFLRFDTFVFLL